MCSSSDGIEDPSCLRWGAGYLRLTRPRSPFTPARRPLIGVLPSRVRRSPDGPTGPGVVELAIRTPARATRVPRRVRTLVLPTRNCRGGRSRHRDGHRGLSILGDRPDDPPVGARHERRTLGESGAVERLRSRSVAPRAPPAGGIPGPGEGGVAARAPRGARGGGARARDHDPDLCPRVLVAPPRRPTRVPHRPGADGRPLVRVPGSTPRAFELHPPSDGRSATGAPADHPTPKRRRAGLDGGGRTLDTGRAFGFGASACDRRGGIRMAPRRRGHHLLRGSCHHTTAGPAPSPVVPRADRRTPGGGRGLDRGRDKYRRPRPDCPWAGLGPGR